FWRNDQTATTPATHLAAFATSGSRFVRGPFMSRAFFVRGAPTLAGDLALLLGRHRCETSSFFTFSCIHRRLRPQRYQMPCPSRNWSSSYKRLILSQLVICLCERKRTRLQRITTVGLEPSSE